MYGLLASQTIHFSMILRILTQCRIRSDVSVTTQTFGRIVSSQGVLILRHFRSVNLHTLIRPSLRLLFCALSSSVGVRAIFIHTMRYTRPTLTGESSQAMTTSGVHHPLANFIVVRTRSSAQLLEQGFIFRAVGLQLGLQPIGVVTFTTILQQIVNEHHRYPKQFNSLSTSHTTRTLSRDLLDRQVYSTNHFTNRSTFFRSLTYYTIHYFLNRLLNSHLDIIFHVGLSACEYQLPQFVLRRVVGLCHRHTNSVQIHFSLNVSNIRVSTVYFHVLRRFLGTSFVI